jgi:hypothetical protein
MDAYMPPYQYKPNAPGMNLEAKVPMPVANYK